jgi:hypothetical protein
LLKSTRSAIRGSTNGAFPSLKMRRAVRWFGQLARDYLYLLELDSEVIAYEERPFNFNYTLDAKERSYTPAFLVHRAQAKQLIGFSRRSYGTDIKQDQMFLLLCKLFQQQGYEFKVVTEAVIREQPRLDNAKVLWRYAATPINAPQYQLYCQEFFRDRADVQLSELIRFFETKRASRREIYALIFRGLLHVDLALPLTLQSLVSLAGI